MATGYKETLSGNGQTTAYDVIGAVFVSLTGTFGGGTAKIQRQDSGGTWTDIAGASYTAAAAVNLNFPPGSENTLRVDLSGSTTPSLVVDIQG